MVGDMGRLKGSCAFQGPRALKTGAANRVTRKLTDFLMAALVLIALQSCTETEPSHDAIIREDLLSIIETLGEPCEQVSDFEPTPGISYSVTCDTGDRYLLSVSPEGKVDIKDHD